jgi:hypothetical protein
LFLFLLLQIQKIFRSSEAKREVAVRKKRRMKLAKLTGETHVARADGCGGGGDGGCGGGSGGRDDMGWGRGSSWAASSRNFKGGTPKSRRGRFSIIGSKRGGQQ